MISSPLPKKAKLRVSNFDNLRISEEISLELCQCVCYVIYAVDPVLVVCFKVTIKCIKNVSFNTKSSTFIIYCYIKLRLSEYFVRENFTLLILDQIDSYESNYSE